MYAPGERKRTEQVLYRLFSGQGWTDTGMEMRRELGLGFRVEVIDHGGNYQPMIWLDDGTKDDCRDAGRLNTPEEAKGYAWECLKGHLLRRCVTEAPAPGGTTSG